MSSKQLKAIALVVAVLLLAWGASELVPRASDTTAANLRVPSFTETDVDTVAIAHGGDLILLAKRASPRAGWTVNGFAADSSGVRDLLRALGDSAHPELAAQSSSSFARMGVDSTGGRVLRVAGGGRTLTRLIVGGRGPEYDAFYVRMPGDTHVYLWHGKLANLAQRSADDWRDHQIAAVSPDSIAEVEIRRAAKRVPLRKRGGKWERGDGAPADSAAVARFLERFRSVTATGFATKRQADSLISPRARRSIVIRGRQHRELLTLTFDSAASGYWVRRPPDSTVYRLEFWQVDQLTPAESTLTHRKR